MIVINYKVCQNNRVVLKTNLIFLLKRWDSQTINHQTKAVLTKRNTYILCFEFFLFILAYLVFFIYPIEILFSVTVLHYDGLDSGIKGSIFALFIIQIIFKFNISFFLRGKEILDRKSIKWNYIRKIYNGRFFWDCISLLGLLIDTFSINFQHKWITYLFFYTKLVFVYEFDTFILQYLQLNKRSLAGYKVLRLLLIILLIANLIACIFYKIAIVTQDKYTGSWINPYLDDEDSTQLIYLYSLYWSITTMTTVGYGDITPQNPMEILYTIAVMLISTVTFSYTINQVLEIISNITSAEESVQRKITTIQRYMRDKNVNEDLQNRILNYIKFQLMEDKERDKETEQDIINMLPPQVKAELFYDINTFFFKNFEWSNRFSEQFITALSYEIEEIRLTEEITLYEPSYVENEDDINLYYLASGQIEIKKDLPQYNQGQGLQLNIIKENSFIGLYSFVSGTLIKEVLKCKTSVKVFIIKRHKFLETIQNFPEDLVKYYNNQYFKFNEISNKIQKLWNFYKNKIINQRKYEEFNLQCYNCMTHNHILEECQLMNRKQTVLDRRQRKTLGGTQQKSVQINDEIIEDQKYLNRRESDYSQISSSQLNNDLLNQQKIQEESQINEEEQSQSLSEKEDNIVNKNEQSQISKKSVEKEESDKEMKDNPNSLNQKLNQKKQKIQKSVHVSDNDNDLNNSKQSNILNVTRSNYQQDSFIQLQEQNIDDHIKHQVYQETEQDKWEQRAKIKEKIAKKQSFQQKRSLIGSNTSNADDILLQIILSIQTILQQNNMDINSLQTQTQGFQFKNIRTQSQQYVPSIFSNNINKK